MKIRRWPIFSLLIILLLVMVCTASQNEVISPAAEENIYGKSDWAGVDGNVVEPLNTAAGDLVLYELQVRSANACHPDTGGSACSEKLAPAFNYYGPGCNTLADLQAIRKSTLNDLLATAETPNRTTGITLQYIDEVVGANAIWLMPIYPHNFRYNLPDACDDIGSPYAVRDYYHVRGTLSNSCIEQGQDEWSDPPCYGNEEFKKVISAAHDRGLKVFMDLAFNHLGHEYLFYDYKNARPIRDLLLKEADLWDFEGTSDQNLLWPEILDNPADLPPEAADVLKSICDSLPAGQEAVRFYLMWREGFDYEREAMDCQRPSTLENQLPGFYLGSNGQTPSDQISDNYTNNWVDVKFLFNNETDVAHSWEFARTREFAFRVVNYYLALGVDGFRMDHANGLTENEWRYIFRKAKFYQEKRNMPTPIFLSESFHNIAELNRVFDILTEGYHHDITHGKRDTAYLEQMLFLNRSYLKDLSYILLNLETHDEGRLLQESTGFDIWRGATFYALAAASKGTLMLQAGQEWGEPWDLGFRRSDYLRGRFPEEANWNPEGDPLTSLYRNIHQARMAPENIALRHGKYYFLRTDKGETKEQLLAMVKYMPDCTNTVFTFYRLWVTDAVATYMVPPDLAQRICLNDTKTYELVDVFSGQNVWKEAYPNGRTGSHLREFGLYVHLPVDFSFQWLRLQEK